MQASREDYMKRWFPLLFLGLTLLANIAERIQYTRFLDGWTPGAMYPVPQWIGLFVFFSVPFSLILLWWMWRPSPEQLGAMSRTRKRTGTGFLMLAVLVWLYFLQRALFAAWLTATPVADLLFWERQHALMANYAALTLGLGGLLALWLKGIRMPPRNPDGAK
jgi:hypothetical protein